MHDPSPRSNWNYPPRSASAPAASPSWPRPAERPACSAPLLVTDPFLATQPMTKAALDILDGAGLEAAMFSDIKPNPVETNVTAGLDVLKAGGHDGVVAFGGGSALDAGKVIAFMAGQTRPMWDFEDIGDWWTRADPRASRPSSPCRPPPAPAPRSAGRG